MLRENFFSPDFAKGGAMKTALITGAAAGIGAAAVARFKSDGYRIIGLDIVEADGVDQYIKVDMKNNKSIEAAVSKIDGKVDVICNIAGVPPTAGVYDTLMVNFFGLRYFTELVFDKLADNASIVNVASLAGLEWSNNIENVRKCLATKSMDDVNVIMHGCDLTDQNVYFFTKQCVIVWTMSYWNRFRERGIRMNAVSPGPVQTNILSDFIQTLGERAEKDTKRIERPAYPAEVASVIAFLCSPDATFIRGANIGVDNGLLAAAMQEQYEF